MPTVKELKAQAKAKGMKGYSKMRKPELMTLLGIAPEPKGLKKTKFAPGVSRKSTKKSYDGPMPKALKKTRFAPGVKVKKL